MNERIQELALQATIHSPEGFYTYTQIDAKKFSELIVKECLSVGEDVANADGEGPWFEGYISGVEEVNRRIKQHFGVEE